VLARQLAPEGASLRVGAPIAVVCDADAADAPPAPSTSGGGGGGGAARLREAEGYDPPTTDVYDGAQPAVRVLEWQARWPRRRGRGRALGGGERARGG
jgi:pyruvate/2-oxoglutarate dehydrogenase complex dihydrolipoamide acyltransferase (E2) component